MGKQGTPTGTVYTSPARSKRIAAARRRQEARWAARSGPVTITRVDQSMASGADERGRASEAAAPLDRPQAPA